MTVSSAGTWMNLEMITANEATVKTNTVSLKHVDSKIQHKLYKTDSDTENRLVAAKGGWVWRDGFGVRDSQMQIITHGIKSYSYHSTGNIFNTLR